MTNVLLTLGRLPKALDIARGFAAIGCRVFVAEPYGRTLTGASRAVTRSHRVPPPSQGKRAYLDSLRDVVVGESIDLVVPVSEETMHVAFLRDRLPPGVALFTMTPDQVLALYDKERFITEARRWGLGVPETCRLGTPGAGTLVAAGDVVVKPIHSCSGRGVRVLRRGAVLPAAEAMPPCIVQRFVGGQIYSSCSIAHRGVVSASAIYRGTLMSGTVAVAFARVDDQPGIAAWIETFVAAAGWTGFISFDFIVDDDGEVFAIECNPRATSGLHFWQPADIARAIIDPTVRVALRPERDLQQFYSCLTETQGAMLRRDGFRDALRRLFTTRDVSWNARDPMPFLTMIVTSWPIIRAAVRRGVPFGEVATLDIGWYDGDTPPV